MITLFLFALHVGYWVEYGTFDSMVACEARGEWIVREFYVDEYRCLEVSK